MARFSGRDGNYPILQATSYGGDLNTEGREKHLKPGQVSDAVLEHIALKNPKAKEVKPETFFDSTVIRERDKSGFIDSLYGK